MTLFAVAVAVVLAVMADWKLWHGNRYFKMLWPRRVR
jgi:hypothetical protein